jgi:hypothetical protein
MVSGGIGPKSAGYGWEKGRAGSHCTLVTEISKIYGCNQKSNKCETVEFMTKAID